MKTPFIYGIAAEKMYFTDREKETKRLLLNFENGLNTIIVSPRRWGKTSLVNKVAELMHFCYGNYQADSYTYRRMARKY